MLSIRRTSQVKVPMHPKYQNNSKRGDSELYLSRFAQAEDYFNKALKDLEQDEEAQKLKYLEEQAYQFDPAFWGKMLQEEIRIRKGLMQVYFGSFKDCLLYTSRCV